MVLLDHEYFVFEEDRALLRELRNTGIVSYIDHLQHKQQPVWMTPWPETRHGDNVAGRCLETVFGVAENNRRGSDLPIAELKASQSEAAQTVLFTSIPETPPDSITRLVDAYGTLCDDGNRRLGTNLGCNRISLVGTSAIPICVALTEDSVCLQDNQQPIACWSLTHLNDCADRKLGTLLLVKAQRVLINEQPHFRFISYRLFQGFQFRRFVSLLHDGVISIHLRITRYADGTRKDRGCAFRLRQADLPRLYDTVVTGPQQNPANLAVLS